MRLGDQGEEALAWEGWKLGRVSGIKAAQELVRMEGG